MSPETLEEALRATSGWDHRFQVHFTGGEPFLRFSLLLQGVRIASELGIPSYAETNAGWCVNGATTLRRFVALRDAGMSAILISCSPFHAESVPLARTLLAIQKATEVFGRQQVIVYMAHCLPQIRQFSINETVSLERYVDRFGLQEAGQMLWDAYGIIPAGRAGYQLGHLTRKQPARAWRLQNCRTEILYAHHSHLDLYGNYISWFCGGLALGDWHDLPRLLSEVETQRHTPIIDLLINSGPHALFERAQREYGYEELPFGYAGKCHLCVDVRKHLSQRGMFAELQPAPFYEMI
ncbi:MAG TPA: radical SAM protein [Anaerolineae bacterium]|jgi:hypothetical protein|nr:radical SAM protein [Anaerolineae bacterium]